jgi:IclR family transcriptional regulator, KDG regulon repressor
METERGSRDDGLGRADGGVRTTTRSVGHTLDALELLASSDTPLGVSEVAERLSLSRPGAHRLLATLLDRGYAEQDETTTKYALGLRAFGLATLAASRRDLRGRAERHLRALNEATGETVHLAVYDDGHVVYLDRLESRQPVGPISRIGARAPAHCVATGRAIIAYLPAGEIEALLAREIERFTDATPVTREEIMDDIEATRRRGWALNTGSWRADVGGVAAPLRDYSGRVVASLGCCVPSSRLTRETTPALAERTLAAAAATSAELGFVAPEPPRTAPVPS